MNAALCCLCLQVDSVEAALELCELAAALLQSPLAWEERWRKERAELLLQLLRVSHRCLVLNGDCRPPLGLMQQLLPLCRQVSRDVVFFSGTRTGTQRGPALCAFRICRWRSC